MISFSMGREYLLFRFVLLFMCFSYVGSQWNGRSEMRTFFGISST
jgi:hypothetical protein